MRKSIVSIILLAGASVVCSPAAAEGEKPPEPKNVPELLVTSSGDKVTTREQWENVRRPELVKLLCTEEYGFRPVERPADLAFIETAAPEACFGGKAIRKRVRAMYSGPGGYGEMNFSVWIPKLDRSAAVFVHSSPRPHESAADPAGPRLVYLLPAELIVSRGYACVAYCNQDVAVDWNGPAVGTSGVFKVYGPQNANDRGPTEWGIISAWAWGMSRVFDWIETEPLLDAKRVAAIGLSRNGKTALVAGAMDTRFAMTISCCSGCSGAKLNHMRCEGSESIEAITRPALRWFCPNYKKYAGRDGQTPFDQHQLLALIAPRLLYVSSATDDAWAGPRGEYASAKLASPAWELYGLGGLASRGFPHADMPLHAGSIGYHLRTGMHDITEYDWNCYLDFADGKGWNTAGSR